jgi:hypothetical protein
LYWDRKENVRCLDIDAIPFLEELVLRHGEAVKGRP